MPRKREFPFRKANGNVIWTITNGKEIVMDWDEFVKLVESDGYREYIALPRKEFEEYYKRMRMPASAREYHANAKRKVGGRS